MKELIKINADIECITVSARDLHKYIGVSERFGNWFERMTQYGLIEEIDYTSVKNFTLVNNGARREIDDFQLTIDAAKQIAMLQRNEKGLEVRKYFIEVEKMWNTPEKIMARALDIAQKEISNLSITIQEQQPKVEFFDQVVSSKDAVEMGKVAKVLNIPGFGRNKLFDFLRSKGVLMRNNLPYQKYCDSRHFRVVETKFTTPDGEVKINYKTLVYQKGLNYIRKLVEKEKYQ